MASITQGTLAIYLTGGVHGQMLWQKDAKHVSRYRAVVEHPGIRILWHGVIVNMASMAHRRGGPGSSIHYAAAKGAVVSMTLGVAREFATKGVRGCRSGPVRSKHLFRARRNRRPS